MRSLARRAPHGLKEPTITTFKTIATTTLCTLAAATALGACQRNDGALTTAVSAELAKDSQLSGLKINVDTSEGRVVLRGSAPNDASRERATALASRVDGVVASTTR